MRAENNLLNDVISNVNNDAIPPARIVTSLDVDSKSLTVDFDENNSPFFSIIIPVYNGESYIHNCLLSIENQKKANSLMFEVIVIDDCSTDQTLSQLQLLPHSFNINILTTPINSGPGIARNIGISAARGKWIIFLDADDLLSVDALEILYNYIKDNDVQIVGFDWQYTQECRENQRGGRTDLVNLTERKQKLICDYISLKMDGSVIYTAIERRLIINNEIVFHRGFHEDIDFILKVYFHAKKIGVVNNKIYLKNNRSGSIINRITASHIEGFFRAFNEIHDFLIKQDSLSPLLLRNLYVGFIGIVATRIREIWMLDPKDKMELYQVIYTLWKEAENRLSGVKKIVLKTKYFLIHEKFVSLMETNDDAVVSKISSFMKNIKNKMLSCYDLHHSVFFAPDEIRTCCKRFFVNGIMKGDVVLLNKNNYTFNQFTNENILKEKKDLFSRINKGEAPECDGCPFLEFDEWGDLDELKPEHLSLEYHSVCNMKCEYCSDKYYGGKEASYDIYDLLKNIDLSLCNSIVWGGGEPTLDKEFPAHLRYLSNKFPNLKQRVITNSTKFIDALSDAINNDRANVITSIDAGTKSKFFQIRQNKGFDRVISNLKKYASLRPQNITIKYIFTENNNDKSEVLAFVKTMLENELLSCNFQISYDFKKETVDAMPAVSAILLYGLLVKSGCRYVFFDDLLRQRISSIPLDRYTEIVSILSSIGQENILANKEDFSSVIIWGAGAQTKLLLENSNFFKMVSVKYIVDNTPSKINTQFLGVDVYHPDKLYESDDPILISAVQSSPKILEVFNNMGLSSQRLIKGLVI
ncbi:glycosyltransferase [Pectobacteriaceae bacterium CE90]|nr:glycosyltransferase [Pectobacteriaceae bacterium CE90]